MSTQSSRQPRGSSSHAGHKLIVVVLAFACAAITGAWRFSANGSHAGGAPQTVTLPPVSAAASDCTTDTTLCLSEGRFIIVATWTKPDGESGSAHAVNMTADSGYFWFFDSANIEVAVKTLNGCGVDGHYWFFSAGLTNLKVEMTVTDTATNTTKTYHNSQGTAFQPITDTTAFSSCSVAASAFSGNPEQVSTEAPAEQPAPVRAATEMTASVSGCVTTDTTLCTSGRFQVGAYLPDGGSVVAHAVQLTSESGYFWFFDPSNVELVVKTADACSIGQGHWFFAAGMTTVNVNLTVIDTLDFSNTFQTYTYPPGAVFPPIQDTSSFLYCPGFPTHYNVPIVEGTLTRYCKNGRFDASNYDFARPIHARVGDTVTWTWSDPSVSHSTTAYDGSWDSGAHLGPFTFSHTFTQAGTFDYDCSVGHRETLIAGYEHNTQQSVCSYDYIDNAHEASNVIVDLATTPTPALTLVSSPTPTQTPSPTATSHATSPTPTPTSRPPMTYVVSLSCNSSSGVRCRNGYFHDTHCELSSPAIQIYVGDTVRWEWQDPSIAHSTTSGVCLYSDHTCFPDGAWDSGVHQGPFTFSRTFTQVGTFTYFCNAGYQKLEGIPSIGCSYFDLHEVASVIVNP